MTREKLFSVTKADLVEETFRAGGKGGQHQNKTNTGVRLRHPPSGAVAESRSSRSQAENRQLAFKKLVATDAFTRWLRVETARRLGKPSIEDVVEQQMAPGNIKVEVKDEKGRWTPATDELTE